ncbi:MAG TPA: hypothetical protein VFE24_14645 [Pirellulales bacterium]|jgi:hypothetical protein|nr:hypothetical protein [Pirellulales bacterium]
MISLVKRNLWMPDQNMELGKCLRTIEGQARDPTGLWFLWFFAVALLLAPVFTWSGANLVDLTATALIFAGLGLPCLAGAIRLTGVLACFAATVARTMRQNSQSSNLALDLRGNARDDAWSCTTARMAALANSLLENTLVAFFNVAKCRAEFRTARKIVACVVILASHPCDDAAC